MALSVAEVSAAFDDGDETIRHGAIVRLDLAERGAIGVLLRAMADESWRVRREAVQRAVSGPIDHKALIPALVPHLGEPEDVGLRNAVIEAVVAIGREAAPAVQGALAERPDHAKVLCDVLGRIGDPQSAGALVACLHDPDANVQIAAAEALGRLQPGGGEEAARALDSRLGELISARTNDGVPELLGAALLDAIARRGAVLAGERVLPLLTTQVLGAAALKALADGAVPAGPDDLPAILAAVAAQLDSPVRARREIALKALARLLPATDGDAVKLSPAALAGATEALLEATLEVQRAAALVLGAYGGADAARALVVASDDPALTEIVERALARLAQRDLRALSSVVGTMGPRARAALYHVLASRLDAPPPGSSAELHAALSADVAADDNELAAAALLAIGALGEEGSASQLVDALARAYAQRANLEEPWERIDVAQRALLSLGGRRRAAVLTELRARGTVPPVVLLLGKLGDASDAQTLLTQLGAPDADARRRAADAIAALVARPEVVLDGALLERASEAAGEALVDEAPEVRAAAIGALAAAEARRPVGATRGAIEGLLRATRDEDVRVRGAAARALVELSTRTQGEVAIALRVGLRALSDASDPLTAVPALEALLALHDPADDARVLDALTGSGDEARKVALHSLGSRPGLLSKGQVRHMVERALYHGRWDLRRAAVVAMMAAGESGRPALVALRVSETDPLVRAELDRALQAGPAGAAST